MTHENEQAVRAAFQTGATEVTDAAREQFVAQMRARGLDPSQTLAKHAPQQPGGSKPSAASPATPPQRLSPDIDAQGVPRLNAAQVEQAAATLRRYWSGDPAVLEAELARAGAKPLAEPIADTRTDEQREFDSSTLAPPVDPASYDLNGLWLDRAARDGRYDVAELPALEGAIRSTMAELSIPKVLGRTFAEDMADSASVFGKLSEKGDDVAVQRYHLEQSALFARVTKVGWAEAAAQMKPWLARMSKDAREFLADSGALESAPARVRLWQSFQLQQARSRMGGKP